MNMHWKLNTLSPQCRNVIWQDELYQLVSSAHVCLALVSPYFVNGRVSFNLYSFLSKEIPYFLHSLHSLEKLKEQHTFKSCIKKRFWFLKKLQISQKQKIIRGVNSSSTLPLLCILSSRFAASLVYTSFCLYPRFSVITPWCDVIYV